MLGLSCNDVESHLGWIKDIQVQFLVVQDLIQTANDLTGEFPYPIIADPKRDLAVKLGMLDPVEKDAAGIPLTARAVRFRPCSTYTHFVHTICFERFMTRFFIQSMS